MTHPAPLVRCRPAQPGETPRNAAALAKTARAGGWTAVLTYARGTSLTSKCEPGPVVESVTLRLVHPLGHRGVAVWTDGGQPQAWVAPAGMWWHEIGFTGLRGLLRDMTSGSE